MYNNQNQNVTFGNNYSAGSGANQIGSFVFYYGYSADNTNGSAIFWERTLQLSGTWKWMGATGVGGGSTSPFASAIAVRVS
jgi:hypothetical protein